MHGVAAAGQRAFGFDRGLPFPVSDLAETDTLLLWGTNPAETMPPLLQWLARQRERGGRLFVVDPRRTETARLAEPHLVPTRAATSRSANGLLFLALEEDLVDCV